MKTPSYDSQARLLWGDKPPVVATDAPFASAPSRGRTWHRGKSFNEDVFI